MGIRVLLIQLWPNPGNVCYTVPLLESLSEIKGLSVEAWLSYKFPKKFRFKGVKVRRIFCPFEVNKKNLPALLAQPFMFLQFLYLFFTHRAIVLHINYTYPWLTVIYPFLRWKFKVVHTLHDVQPHFGEEKLRNRLGIMAVIRYADVIIVHGKALKRRLVEDLGVSEQRVMVIPHGHMEYTTRFGDKEIAEEPYTVLFAGRILPYKGLNYLLEAFERVLKEVPEARLIIAGRGNIKPYKDAIKKLKGAVEVHNRVVTDVELANFFRRASIVVVPYVEGSQSGPLITGCTFGKAVIATRVGSFSEIIEDGINGVLVEPADVEQLASAIVVLLKDPACRRRFGQRAQERVMKELSWEKIASMTYNVYRDLIKE